MLNNNTYTTNAITANCTVVATFNNNSSGATSSIVSTIQTGLSSLFLAYSDNVVVAPDGSIYFAETSGHQIKKIAADGKTVTVYAGAAVTTSPTLNGACSYATFSHIIGITMDAAGAIYVVDADNLNSSTIRKITPQSCQVTTVGTVAADAGLAWSIIVDASGNVVFPMGNTIAKMTPAGQVVTVAGSGAAGHTDGPALSATFNWPQYIAIDAAGNVYVSEYMNFDIRKITPDGVVSTLAGGQGNAVVDGVGDAAFIGIVTGLAFDNTSGNLYESESTNQAVRQISPTGVVTTIAGIRYDPSIPYPSQVAVGVTDSGTPLDSVFLLGSLIGIDANGVIYTSVLGNNGLATIHKVTPIK